MSLTKTKIDTFLAVAWNNLILSVDTVGMDITKQIVTKTIQNFFDNGKLTISEVKLSEVLDSINDTETFSKTDSKENPYSREVMCYFDCLQFANSEVITDGMSSKESNFPLINQSWENAQKSIVSTYQNAEKRIKSVVAKFSDSEGKKFKPTAGNSEKVKKQNLENETLFNNALAELESLYSQTLLRKSSRQVYEIWNLKKNGKICRLKLYNGSEEAKGKIPPKDVLKHFRGEEKSEVEVEENSKDQTKS